MRDNKITNLDTAIRIVAANRIKGRTIVFTNGCFDIVHRGHIKLLEEAKAKGDFLIVGLNSDASIRRIKGPDRPVQDEQTRASVMAALLPVDLVVLFEEDTPLKLIESLTPDVLVKGGDWEESRIVGASHVREHGGQVITIALEEGYSTTSAIEKIIAQCKSKH